jgi:hypothetical protein
MMAESHTAEPARRRVPPLPYVAALVPDRMQAGSGGLVASVSPSAGDGTRAFSGSRVRVHVSARSSTRPTTFGASKYSSARSRARRLCRS